MEFFSGENASFMAGANKNNSKIVEVEKTKDFFFWGMLTGKGEFAFENETKGEGVVKPSYVTIEQKYSLSDLAFTLLSLGLYAPVTYKIIFLSDKQK